jgi:hypothetical protein
MPYRVETKACIQCGKTHSVELDDEQYAGYLRWKNREGHIQDLIPRLNADNREMLMTGTDPICWEILFPPEEDDEEFDTHDLGIPEGGE